MEIRKDAVFGDAPGEAGVLWRNLALAENALAEMLKPFPVGAVIACGDSAWYLEEDGALLNLVHASFDNGQLVNPSSRFDFDLDWVDTDTDGLSAYIDKVNSAIGSFSPAELFTPSSVD